MLARRRGSIVNIASRAALELPAGLAAYATAKRAVLSLAEILQKEVGDRGVRVNTIAPDDDRHAGEPRRDADRGLLAVDAARARSPR